MKAILAGFVELNLAHLLLELRRRINYLTSPGKFSKGNGFAAESKYGFVQIYLNILHYYMSVVVSTESMISLVLLDCGSQISKFFAKPVSAIHMQMTVP